MIGNQYTHIPNRTLKTKMNQSTRTDFIIFTKDRNGKTNQQLFSKQMTIQLPLSKTAATSALPIFYFKLK